MFKNTLFVLLILNISTLTYAEVTSYKVHKTKIDSKVENCTRDADDLANEILAMEVAGMRWLKSKPACFESLKMKYVHAVKNPDEASPKLVAIKKGSAKVDSVNYNPDFYSYKVNFSVTDKDGKQRKDSFSFMTNTKFGAKKPQTGCALISASPVRAYVNEDCL